DQSQRDGQFRGRIMETSRYPTATFTLTKPIDLGSVPATGVTKTYQATGDLTLHGVTKSVSISLETQRSGAQIKIGGQIPIVFADYNVSNPSFPGVTTEDNGIMEVLLVLTKS
uniref:YceI family protein n=1 Tax=Frankia sp. Cr1 TaxID=3073931 RepID=UPI002AD4CF05